METVTIRKSDLALPANQALYEDEDGCPFAAPQKPAKPAIAAKFGAVPNLLRTTVDGVECVAVPLAYMAQVFAGVDGNINIAKWIADGAPELDAMSADLDALRSGAVKPLATMTLNEAAAVGQEWIGKELCEQPWEW